MAISLFSVLFFFLLVGCGSTKRVLSPKKSYTLSDMQRNYEHIPKPIDDIPPTTNEQRKEFNRFLKEVFADIEKYKKELKKNSSGAYRYGKNELPVNKKSNKRIERNKTKSSKLYPSLPASQNSISDPLSKASE